MKYEMKICVSSPPDRDKLVAEIFFDNQQWAEVNQERGELWVEFYARQDGHPWSILFSDAVNALQQAEQRLA